MLFKLKIIDKLSLKGIPDCKIEVKITAPMYKSIIYTMENIEVNNEQVVDLELLDLLDEDPVTA